MSSSVSARTDSMAAHPDSSLASQCVDWRGVLSAATPGVAFDTLPGAQLALDVGGRVIAATPGAARLFGREIHELRDRGLHQLLPSLPLSALEAGSGETHGLHRGGELLPLRWDLGPYDRTLGLQVLMLQDLGNARALEGELTRARQRLARLHEEIERLACIASNDLQEPLRMVVGFTELLTRRYRERLDDQGRELLHFAHDGARRTRTLLNALFEYSRLGTEALPLQTVDLSRVRHETARTLSLALQDAGGSLVATGLPVVSGRRAHLRSLFYQLLSNAIHFRAPERELRIELSATRIESAWQLCFADNGSGIPVDHRTRVTELFQRLPRDRRQPGAGLGLALCRKICELQGGSLEIDANTPAGTRVVVTWPDAAH